MVCIFNGHPRGKARWSGALGAVFDVVLDLRPESVSYRQWTGFELTAENRECVYIPPGCAWFSDAGG